MEQFANNCLTYVAAGGYTSGSGVLNVDSTAAPFPQVGDFRISIFDQATGDLTVILKVTAVSSGTQFAVTAEGTDASAAEDDVVRGTMITAASIESVRGLVLIEEKSANDSASLDFTSLYTSLFDELRFEFIRIIPATSTEYLKMLMSTNGGSSYDTGANYGYYWLYQGAAAGSQGGNSGQSFIRLTAGTSSTAANGGSSGSLLAYDFGSTAGYKHIQGHFTTYDQASNLYIATVPAYYGSTSAVNAVRFIMSSGNISSGIIRLYGFKK